MGTALWWTHNGSVIQRAMFTRRTLNQNFIITNAGINASGIYTCRDAINNPVLQQNISVTVLPGNDNTVCRKVYWVCKMVLCTFVCKQSQTYMHGT